METVRVSMRVNIWNRVFIGFMVGLEEMLGRAAQATANIIGEYVGKELLRYAEEEGREIKNLGDLRNLLVDLGLTSEITFQDLDEGNIKATIKDCGICPKRVGGYEFEGTACPWPGILRFMLEKFKECKYRVDVKVEPGETCILTFRPKLS